MFNFSTTAKSQDHGANPPGSEPPLQGWTTRLGMSFEEFDAMMSAAGDTVDALQPLPANIAAGFVC